MTPRPAGDADEKSRRRHSPVAEAIGAVLRGYRKGDDQVRERVKAVALGGGKATAKVGGYGFAVYVALRLLTMGERVLEHEWQTGDQQRAALVSALAEQTQEIKGLVRAIRESHEDASAEHAAMMERIGTGRR